MSRASVVYISMFILLGAGLWTVLAVGHGLIAPADVSGYWRVHPIGSEQPGVGDGVELEQSGRYLHVRTAENVQGDLKLVSTTDRDASTGLPVMRFAGNGLELTIQGLPTTHHATLRLSGRNAVADAPFDARRTVYQGKPVAKESPPPASRPAATTQHLSLSSADSTDAPER